MVCEDNDFDNEGVKWNYVNRTFLISTHALCLFADTRSTELTKTTYVKNQCLDPETQTLLSTSHSSEMQQRLQHKSLHQSHQHLAIRYNAPVKLWRSTSWSTRTGQSRPAVWLQSQACLTFHTLTPGYSGMGITNKSKKAAKVSNLAPFEVLIVFVEYRNAVWLAFDHCSKHC